MRILLPPSEAKHQGGTGRSLERRSAGHPIDEPRQLAFTALDSLLADPGAAATALLLPPSVAQAAIADNGRVRTSPTMPAMRRYAGVLYEGLAITGLSQTAQTAAGRDLLIFSGLFGVLRGRDPVPTYRVPAKASLPGLGSAAGFWRAQLPELMPALLDGGPLIDLRSSDYAPMWQPAPGDRRPRNWVTVRVLSRRPDGSLGVISYSSKLGKGRLAGALLERQAAGEAVTSAEDVADAWRRLGGSDARLRPATRGLALDLLT